VHYVLATALSANNQERDALAEYRRAAELTPTNPAFLDHLAVSLALNGDTEGAIEQLQRAISIDPASFEYRFNLAYVLESEGKFAEAIPPLEKAVTISRGRDWRCLAELAKVYDKTGRTADAARAVRQALDEATRQNNEPAAKALQELLDRYQHSGPGTKSN
jgi:Flp pilus assembly protein TadD